MLRSLMTISGFTLMSRILGVMRDILIARFLGTGMVADAFFAAFRFPNMFRRIFGEGAFNAAFIPLFGKRVTRDGCNSAMQFANNAFTILFGSLGLLTLLAIPLMAAIMLVVVPGFLPKAEENLGSEAIEFRIPLRGAKAVYLQTKEGEARFENLSVVKRGNPAFVNVFGEVFGGEVKAEGEEVELASVILESFKRNGEVEFKTTDTEEDKKIKIEAARDQIFKDGDWLVNDGGLLRIPLPPDHDYAVFKGMASGGGELAIYNNDPGAYDLTVKLSQITFVYLLCMALVAHLSGVLTTLKRFAAPAFSPVILNLVFLCGLLGLVQFVEWRGVALACCVALAGFLQLGVLWWVCFRAGLPVVFKKPVFDSSFKRLLVLMGPGVIAAGIQQINLLVGGIVASFQQGAISYIYYADRIYQLPLGMIGIAFGMVLLPEITRLLHSGKEGEARATMVSGLELAMIVTVPAAIALMVIPQEIISVIFERGTFTSSDSFQTGRALGAFAIGLPGYVLIKVLQPGYFARENTKSPMWMAGITVIVNIVFSLVLFPFFGHVGIAIATSIAAWVNVVLLWIGLREFVTLSKENWRRLRGMVIASLVMAVGLLGAKALMAGWIDAGPWAKAISTAILVGFGAAIYGVGVLWLRVTSFSELRSAFRK
ncbi:MAG: murein biosynthesis integral membrane protein MurJ [Akkermansiaceae bacterium]|nr:murein biosynthesis integral membrane protein MurJ [Akkermansiaceae bacterium]MDG1362348.1 murein biosynthesis integral membrane protein MurJ [Akkermansiaceae bacterium]